MAEIKIANSNASRDIEMAEAKRKATAAQKVAAARALQEAYKAEEEAELARKKLELAKMQADDVALADIDKQKAIIAAQAEAEKQREIAKGKADAILAKMMAEAKGTEELLSMQAKGFNKLVEAAGGDPQSAIGYLLIDKLTELATIQTGAIKDLDIDKVVVYDNGSGNGVSNFVQGLYSMMPQLSDFLKQSGMDLPDSLVKKDKLKVVENGSKNGNKKSTETPNSEEV
jgi:flotillin